MSITMATYSTSETKIDSLPGFPFQQANELRTLSEKINDLSQTTFSKIAPLTIKYLKVECFKQQTYSGIALKILVLAIYVGLIGLSVLTFYASINLLCNGNLPSAFSSDADTRVSVANTITNAGALLACMTDLPAITYVMYLFIIKKAHLQAIHECLREGYHSCINNPDYTLSPEMREELYQKYIFELQRFGIEDFYKHPDPLSQTGATHAALTPKLDLIDQEINKGVAIRSLWEKFVQTLKQESCPKKIGKVTLVAFPLISVQALSTLLIIENLILLKDTPVSDLFSSNTTDQMNEAFYITQLGGLFSSLTAFGAAFYLLYLQFLKVPYQKAKDEKNITHFAEQFKDLSNPTLIFGLHRIREAKLALNR